MAKINTYGIHEMFDFGWDGKKACFDLSKTESSTVIENNGITLSIDIPDSAVNKIASDVDLFSKSIISKIDYLILTHLDSDHISGLDKLLWRKKFGEKQELNIIAHPENIEALWERLSYGFGQNRESNKLDGRVITDYIKTFPLEFGQELKIPGFGSIKSFDRSTFHSPEMPVTAFKVFDEQKKNIANFSADTKIDTELINFLSSNGTAPIIHEIGAYKEGSHSHTHINELLNTVPEEVQSRIYGNHIPVQMEDSIKQIIENSGSPIKFADKFYSESKQKEVELAKVQKYFSGLNMIDIKEKVPEILNPKTVVFSGSFDPWTYGHEAVVRDYLKMNPNSKIKIVIGINPSKKGTFTPNQRKILIEETLGNDIKTRVDVDIFDGVIADYVYENNCSGIIKGIRDATDFNYEKDIATLSKRFSGDVMTSFIPQLDSSKTGISSSSLKALFNFGGKIYPDADPFVREALRMRQSGQWIIGLTGGIASGKTTLGKGLEKISEKEDIKIHYLNLDEITNIIHISDKEFCVRARNKIKGQFGDDILLLDGTTNKKKLGEIVFKDEVKMQELMDIMLEPLIHLLKKQITEINEPGIILVEGAIIFDRDLTYLFDENIIHIGVSSEKQRKRVEKRDGLTEKQIEHRFKSQISREERIKGIKNIQQGYSKRFFLDIDGDDYDLDSIGFGLLDEYNKRRNIFGENKEAK